MAGSPLFPRLRSLLRALFGRARFERDMTDEMRFHIDACAADLVRRGMSHAEAYRRARAEFGSMESVREEGREARGLRVFDETRQDLRYALRQLRRTPGFSTAAILSLALGIGANTAIFTLTDAVMFRTLPVERPEGLYFLAHRDGTDTSSSANYPLLERYRAARIFAGVTAFEWRGFVVRTSDGFEPVDGQYVSGDYHAVLGVPIQFGRGFTSEPDRPDGRAPIAVISDDYWARKFGRSRDALGKTLSIGGDAVTVVGVTEPGFNGLIPGTRMDVTLPLFVRALDEPEFLTARDGWVSTTLLARLEPGSTAASAEVAAEAVFLPYWMEPDNAWIRGESGAYRRHATLRPAGRGAADLRNKYEKPLVALMALVSVVLLIACANVANLLLARGAARVRELAVRMSIGAGRARLVRQLLTESLLLAVAGGVLGLLVAVGSTRVVLSLFDTGQSPIRLDVALNGRVLAFTTTVCVLTALIFGLLPALKATRVNLAPSLKEGGLAVPGRRRMTLGKGLVVAQIALCLFMVATAGLFVRTLRNLRTVESGFSAPRLLLFTVDTYQSGFTESKRIAVYSEILDRLQALPGVESVSLGSRSPVDFSEQRRRFSVPGLPKPKGVQGVSANEVTPGYFETFGIRLVRGRLLTAEDRESAPHVAVISESAARAYFQGADPIGRTVELGGDKTQFTIVGVVSDVRHEHLRGNPPPMLYQPLAQAGTAHDSGYPQRVTAVVRTIGNPVSLVPLARGAVHGVSPDVPVSYVRTMRQQMDAALVRERLLASLSGGFGGLALLLAFVGLFGVMSYSVARRAREISIRVALGATRTIVVRQVLRETVLVSALGITAGLAGTLAGTRILSTFLFGLSPRDPGTLAVVTLLLLGLTVGAGYLPARRAAGIDPMRSLKGD